MAELKGWARLSWVSDYAQFYLIDRDDAAFAAPVDITPEILDAGYAVLPAGLAIYTNDCLQQQINVLIYDAEPDPHPIEPMHQAPWTRVRDVVLRFPSRAFSVSSPSSPYPLPNGPVFLLDTVDVACRISWMEFEGSRDDTVPVEPDIIEVTLWPRDL